MINNKNALNIQQILMTKINMIEDLLDNQRWDEKTETLMKEKLERYRKKLADLLIKENLA